MSKILLGSARYLELDGGLKKLEYLMLNLPFACNYRCRKCCNSERKGIGYEATDLHISEIISIINEAKKIGIRVLVIAGEGEPFLYRRIKTIIKKASELGIISYIFTNGSILNKKNLFFVKKHNSSLIINMDSLNKERYEMFTGVKGSFDKIMKNLKNAREIFKDTYSKKTDIRRIAINTVISQHNMDELSKLLKFCGNDFVWVLNEPIDIGRASINPEFIYSNEMKKMFKQFSKYSGPLESILNHRWCAYMRNGISVGRDGNVLACAYALETVGRFGNIKNGGLKRHLRKTMKYVDNFYENSGHSRCLLRHRKYKYFIETLESNSRILLKN